MCAPKKPKVEKIPVRAAAIMPDAGDAAVRAGQRNKRRMSTSAMMFAGKLAGIGAPNVSGPIGTGGL